MSASDKFKDLRFDAVIPSHLLLNNNVELSAIKLYAFIRNLTHVEGYCFAKNEYLSDLMGCCHKSIRNWLKSLCDEGYIEVDFLDDRTHTDRRIYLIDDFQRKSTPVSGYRPPGKALPPPRYPVTDIKEDSLKEDILKKDPPLLSSKPKAAKPESFEEWKKRMISLDWKEEEFEEAWKRYLAQPPKSVMNVRKWLLTTLQSVRDEEIGMALIREKEASLIALSKAKEAEAAEKRQRGNMLKKNLIRKNRILLNSYLENPKYRDKIQVLDGSKNLGPDDMHFRLSGYMAYFSLADDGLERILKDLERP